MAAKCSGMSAADSNIALLPTLGFSAKLVMTSPIWLTTTLSRPISASDSPSKKNKRGKRSRLLEQSLGAPSGEFTSCSVYAARGYGTQAR